MVILSSLFVLLISIISRVADEEVSFVEFISFNFLPIVLPIGLSIVLPMTAIFPYLLTLISL